MNEQVLLVGDDPILLKTRARSALDKGVSQAVVENTVKTAVRTAGDVDPDASEPLAEAKSHKRRSHHLDTLPARSRIIGNPGRGALLEPAPTEV